MSTHDACNQYGYPYPPITPPPPPPPPLSPGEGQIGVLTLECFPGCYPARAASTRPRASSAPRRRAASTRPFPGKECRRNAPREAFPCHHCRMTSPRKDCRQCNGSWGKCFSRIPSISLQEVDSRSRCHRGVIARECMCAQEQIGLHSDGTALLASPHSLRTGSNDETPNNTSMVDDGDVIPLEELNATLARRRRRRRCLLLRLRVDVIVWGNAQHDERTSQEDG